MYLLLTALIVALTLNLGYSADPKPRKPLVGARDMVNDIIRTWCEMKDPTKSQCSQEIPAEKNVMEALDKEISKEVKAYMCNKAMKDEEKKATRIAFMSLVRKMDELDKTENDEMKDDTSKKYSLCVKQFQESRRKTPSGGSANLESP